MVPPDLPRRSPVDKVRAATDISAGVRPPGDFVAALPVAGAGLPPPAHYRANVYSIMRDTPKVRQELGNPGSRGSSGSRCGDSSGRTSRRNGARSGLAAAARTVRPRAARASDAGAPRRTATPSSGRYRLPGDNANGTIERPPASRYRPGFATATAPDQHRTAPAPGRERRAVTAYDRARPRSRLAPDRRHRRHPLLGGRHWRRSPGTATWVHGDLIPGNTYTGKIMAGCPQPRRARISIRCPG